MQTRMKAYSAAEVPSMFQNVGLDGDFYVVASSPRSTDEKQPGRNGEEPTQMLRDVFSGAHVDMQPSCERRGLSSDGRQGWGSSLNDMGG
jgi:hypothetical protein